MLTKLFYIFTIFGLVSCAGNPEQTIEPSNLTPSFDLKQEMYDLVNTKGKSPTEISGLQIVLIKKGVIAFEHSEGFARIDSNNIKIPLTVTHKVRIASISKFVLALAFMSLVDEGLVDLDEDVSKYIGFTLNNDNFPDRKITARQLLSHTSSIRDAGHYFLPLGEHYRDFFQPSKHYNNGAHFASGANQGPGDYFTYSNLNFGIIAGIIENVSGLRMDVFVKEKLFNSLNLDISFNVCDLFKNEFASLATLYRRGQGGSIWDTDGPWKSQVDGQHLGCFYGATHSARTITPDISILKTYQIGSNPTLFSPQGGLRASAKDLAMIMQSLLENRVSNSANKSPTHLPRIISEAAIEQMMTPVWQYDHRLQNGNTGGESNLGDLRAAHMMTTYGLSTHIVDLKDWGLTQQSKKLYGHLGSAYGLQGQLWFDPQNGDGMVILITGLGDDPAKPEKTTPLDAIEEVVLRLSLRGLEYLESNP